MVGIGCLYMVDNEASRIDANFSGIWRIVRKINLKDFYLL